MSVSSFFTYPQFHCLLLLISRCSFVRAVDERRKRLRVCSRKEAALFVSRYGMQKH